VLGGEKGCGLGADLLEYSFEDALASKGRSSMGTFEKLWVSVFGVVNGNGWLSAVELTAFMDRELSMFAFESVVVSICSAAAAARSLKRARAAALADGDG